VFGSGLAPRGGAGKFVATGATAALPALDGLDVTVLADIWIGTFGAGWPCVCHETPPSLKFDGGVYHKISKYVTLSERLIDSTPWRHPSLLP
jgi:hypothetical protein